MPAINYSKFDHIGDSDDEDEQPVTPPQARTQPPPNVMDDLEDYFRRMDERRAEAGVPGGQAPASVDRLDESQLAQPHAQPSPAPVASPGSKAPPPPSGLWQPEIL